MHPHGRTVAESLWVACSSSERRLILNEVLPYLTRSSCHPVGAFTLQKFIVSSMSDHDFESVQTMCSVFGSSAVSVSCHAQGRFVISCLLRQHPFLNPKHDALGASLVKELISLSVHPCGQQVLKVFVQTRQPSELSGFYAKLIGVSDTLAADVNGNYVVQEALNSCSADVLKEFHSRGFAKHYSRLSQDKCGSMVVERCLRLMWGQEVVRQEMCAELLGVVGLLINHPFGNFVVQTLVQLLVEQRAERVLVRWTNEALQQIHLAVSLMKPSLRSKWHALLNPLLDCRRSESSCSVTVEAGRGSVVTV
jgi:hypothetical protein